MIARIARATSICPAWPRKAWISAISGAVDPMIASVDSDAITTDASTMRQPSNRPASAQAVENWVPLIRARPFFRAQHDRGQPGLGQRLGAGHALALIHRLARADHRGGHMRQRGQIARRADRSLRRDHRDHAPAPASLRSGQSHPSAHPTRRAPATAVSAPSSGGSCLRAAARPTPQQWDRIRLRCRVAVSSGAIFLLASLPKPVLMP